MVRKREIMRGVRGSSAGVPVCTCAPGFYSNGIPERGGDRERERERDRRRGGSGVTREIQRDRQRDREAEGDRGIG